MRNTLVMMLALLAGSAHAELVAIDDATMSETVGREGLSVLMQVQVKGSMEFQQVQAGETNAFALSNFVINWTGQDVQNATPGILLTRLDVKDDSIFIELPIAQFSVGVKDLEMRQGLRADGSAASVSRFGSVYAMGFDMSKSYVELAAH
ncbi:DUF6160 family protein [Chitinivorax sp. PXF-14]|uniref:DUF6160 family protein n=1 Tax=Chitinivorax sp. PXF-14 TaxID=3230488 RepID=UPI003467A3FE